MSKLMEALRSLPAHELMELERRQRLDAWANPVTGFGTLRDKTAFSRFTSFNKLSDDELSDLYHGDAMAARIVDTVPEQKMRRGFAVDVGDKKANDWLAERFRVLDVRGHHVDGDRWGRLFGGSVILLGADDGRPASMPLMPERADSLAYLYVIDRRTVWPFTWYRTVGHPKLGQPELYMVGTPGGEVFQSVHESRLVLFGGAPTASREKLNLNSWDYSVLQRPYEVLLQYNTGWKATEIMMTDSNQAVWKIANLPEMIQAGQEEALKARLALMDRARSVARAIVIAAGRQDGDDVVEDESFERLSASFADIPAVLDKLCLRLAGAVPMPVTMLVGQSPAGMNATGESDFRWWYDELEAEQQNEDAPRIRHIAEVALACKDSPLRKTPKYVKIEFPPLWSETPSQKATTRKTIIDGDAAAINAGVYLPEEVAIHRSKPDGFETEIPITDKAREAREAALGGELTGMVPEETDVTVPKVELAPTDIAAALTVNEVRASQGFSPLTLPDGKLDPDGEISVAEYKAKLTAKSESYGSAPSPTAPTQEAETPAEGGTVQPITETTEGS